MAVPLPTTGKTAPVTRWILLIAAGGVALVLLLVVVILLWPKHSTADSNRTNQQSAENDRQKRQMNIRRFSELLKNEEGMDLTVVGNGEGVYECFEPHLREWILVVECDTEAEAGKAADVIRNKKDAETLVLSYGRLAIGAPPKSMKKIKRSLGVD